MNMIWAVNHSNMYLHTVYISTHIFDSQTQRGKKVRGDVYYHMWEFEKAAKKNVSFTKKL